MGLSLRQALFASIATSALTLSSSAYTGTDIDSNVFQDNNPTITLVNAENDALLQDLAQEIFQAQQDNSTENRTVRGEDTMWDYNVMAIPLVVAALKSANDGITDPRAIADLAIEITNHPESIFQSNGTPIAGYEAYLNRDIYIVAALIDATVLRSVQLHPDHHTQEELATIVITEILDRASRGENNPERLLTFALNEAMHSMDPHSRFVPQSAVQEMLNDVRGSFSGIGANVGTDTSLDQLEARQQAIDEFLDPYYDEDGYLRDDITEEEIQTLNNEFSERFPALTLNEGLQIEALINDETPAALAGVQAGDLITHVDNESIAGLTVEQAVERIVGPRGSDVQLTIIREGEANPLSITVTRDNVVVSPVRSRMIEGNIGYVHASSFNDQTDRFVDEALQELTAQGAEYFILDLRDNPGGIMGQAAAIVNNFIDGEIDANINPRFVPRRYDADVIERNTTISVRQADGKMPVNFARRGTETDAPMVVLINEGSASASEIVAGVLQAYDRATVIGTQSFGKGSGQSVIPFDFDGDQIPEAIANITSFLYYVGPGQGESIQGQGVTPDIRLSTDFRAVSEPRRSESGLNATLARPDDGDYSYQSEAECRPSSVEITIELPEDFTLRNGNLDPWITCAVAHLTGDTNVPFVDIEPIEQSAPTLDTQ